METHKNLITTRTAQQTLTSKVFMYSYFCLIKLWAISDNTNCKYDMIMIRRLFKSQVYDSVLK